MLIYHQCRNWIRIKWFTFHALWHRPKSIIECFTWKEICKPTLDYIKQKHTLLSQTRWVCLKTFIFLNTSTRYIEGKKKIKNFDISIVFDLSVLRFWISTVHVVTVYVLSLPFYDVIDFLNFWTCQYSRTIYFETVEFQDTLLLSDIFYCYY